MTADRVAQTERLVVAYANIPMEHRYYPGGLIILGEKPYEAQTATGGRRCQAAVARYDGPRYFRQCQSPCERGSDFCRSHRGREVGLREYQHRHWPWLYPDA